MERPAKAGGNRVIYTTIQGDTWDMIAYKVYGNEVLTSQLISANPLLYHMSIFSAGIKVNIPPKPARLPNDLPPWKRVST